MTDTYTANRIAAIAIEKIDDLIGKTRMTPRIVDTDDKEIMIAVQAYTEAKVAILEAALKSYEPPALLAYHEPEQAPLPGIVDTNAPRKRTHRVNGEEVCHYLMDRDGSADVCYIVRDLFSGHRHAEMNCRQMLARLMNNGDISLDWADGRMVRATLRRYPKKED